MMITSSIFRIRLIIGIIGIVVVLVAVAIIAITIAITIAIITIAIIIDITIASKTFPSEKHESIVLTLLRSLSFFPMT